MIEKKMTPRQYLDQAYRLDERIKSKLKQLANLKALATHVTSMLNDVCIQKSHNNHKMEDTILKIYEQENEIDRDIDRLVDLKGEIRHVIDGVQNIQYRFILEKRYLLFESWEKIANDLHLSVQHVFRLHNEALREIDKIIKDESK